MTKYTVKPKKAANKAENTNNNGYNQLAKAWQACHAASHDPRVREELAVQIDKVLKRDFPRMSGWLQGNEDEVRQRAATLLLRSYLEGNALLIAATGRGDAGAVRNELSRSLRAAVRDAKREVLKPIKRQRNLVRKLEDYVDEHAPVSLHPSMHREIWDLPLQAQREVVLSMLREARRDKRISAKAAHIAGAMAEKSLTQAAAAREAGLSRRAAARHVRNAGKYLRRKVREIEFPMG
jgi:hypothetical protein